MLKIDNSADQYENENICGQCGLVSDSLKGLYKGIAFCNRDCVLKYKDEALENE